MSDTDHPELVEFEGETLGDTITNLLAEIIRLRRELESLHAENDLLTSQIRLACEWVEAFHNEGTIISFIEHVYGDEEE